jgi:DNA-binding MarR family transcriptional regulator
LNGCEQIPGTHLSATVLPCVRRAGGSRTQLHDTVLAPCGLSVAQRSVLVHTDRAGSPTMTELDHAMALDRSALAHNLQPLLRDGNVAQKQDAQDGRSRRVELTPRGRAKLAESSWLWRLVQDRFEKVYGPDRAAALRIALGGNLFDRFRGTFQRSGPTAFLSIANPGWNDTPMCEPPISSF